MKNQNEKEFRCTEEEFKEKFERLIESENNLKEFYPIFTRNDELRGAFSLRGLALAFAYIYGDYSAEREYLEKVDKAFNLTNDDFKN